MNLYLDDNIINKQLVALLRKAGHAVVVPADANLSGAPDPQHLTHAIRHGLTLLTGNHKDFEDLHELVLASGGSHPGILLVYFDNDPTRDMKPPRIVSAVAKLEASGAPVRDQLIVLNQWR